MKSAFRAALALAFSVSVCVAQAPVNDECTGASGARDRSQSGAGGFRQLLHERRLDDRLGRGLVPGVEQRRVVQLHAPDERRLHVQHEHAGRVHGRNADEHGAVGLRHVSARRTSSAATTTTRAASRSVVRVAGLLSGLTYYVRVADQATSVATGTFYVTVIPSRHQRRVLEPRRRPRSGPPGLFTTEGATNSAGVTSACPTGTTGSNSDVWFSFTAPGNGNLRSSAPTPRPASAPAR